MILATKNGKAQILHRPCHRAPRRDRAARLRRRLRRRRFRTRIRPPCRRSARSTNPTCKGLYIVGALGGYPLIKQAMNQGYEVIEYILGGKVEPADEPLLKAKFVAMPGFRSVDEALHARAEERAPARAHHAAAVARIHARFGDAHAEGRRQDLRAQRLHEQLLQHRRRRRARDPRRGSENSASRCARANSSAR